MNTSIQIAPVKDGKRLLMVCVAAFIMALNIRTLVDPETRKRGLLLAD